MIRLYAALSAVVVLLLSPVPASGSRVSRSRPLASSTSVTAANRSCAKAATTRPHHMKWGLQPGKKNSYRASFSVDSLPSSCDRLGRRLGLYRLEFRRDPRHNPDTYSKWCRAGLCRLAALPSSRDHQLAQQERQSPLRQPSSFHHATHTLRGAQELSRQRGIPRLGGPARSAGSPGSRCCQANP